MQSKEDEKWPMALVGGCSGLVWPEPLQGDISKLFQSRGAANITKTVK